MRERLRGETVWLSGGTGFLGGLVAATLLERTGASLILPARAHHDRAQALAPIAAELTARGVADVDAALARVEVEPLDPAGALPAAGPRLAARGVTEVVHCAGSVDYFDEARLHAANEELTAAVARLAERAGARRLTFLSTAFSCGDRTGRVAETLHDEPASDPTAYTRSKREAERIAARGSVPTLIVRPSIVIGRSDDGRYGGRKYGLYQLWGGAERLLASEPARTIAVAAPDAPLPLLHQDDFEEAFFAAFVGLDEGVVHITSDPDGLPTPAELCALFARRALRPDRLEVYPRPEDVPADRLDRRQRLFLELSWTHLEIAARGWRFERGALRSLLARGLLTKLPRVTLASVERCQQRFVEGSRRLQRYLRENAERLAGEVEVVRGKGEAP